MMDRCSFLTLMTLALVFALGCAKPMAPGSLAQEGLGTDGDCCSPAPQDPKTPASPPKAPRDPVTGDIGEGLYQGLRAVEIDPNKEMIYLRLPLTGLALVPGFYAEAHVPGLPGATVHMSPLSEESGAGLELHMPLELFKKHIDSRDVKRLPNGDPLPHIPGGELPAFAVVIHPSPDIEVVVYLGPESVAVLYWSKFDPYIKLSSPIYSEGRKYVLGWFHAIPHKRQNFTEVVYPRGGFLLGITLPADLQRQLDDLF